MCDVRYSCDVDALVKKLERFHVGDGKKLCDKCQKRRVKFYKDLCRVCTSNLPKYRGRKRKNRVPPNLELEEDLSQRPTQRRRFEQPNHLRTYPSDHRAAFAKLLGHCNLAANQCAEAIKALISPLCAKQYCTPSRDTAQRCLIEGAVCVDLEMAKRLSTSDELYVGIDETSKSDKRSFIEVEFGGVDERGKLWGHVFRILEVSQHTANDLLKDVVNTLHYVNMLQRKLEMPQTKLYDLRSIVFDWTSVNTGRKKGLYKLLEHKRKKLWRRAIRNGVTSRSRKYEKLVMKGCDDHFVALVAKELEKRIGELAKAWKSDCLSTSRPRSSVKNGVTEMLSEWTKALRKKWKAPLRGFLEQRKRKTFSVTRVSPTRYATFEIAAGELESNLESLLLWVEEAEEDISGSAAEEVFLKIKNNLVQRVLKLMAVIGRKFSLPFMKLAAQITTVEQYQQQLHSTKEVLYSLLRSAESRASFFGFPWLKNFETGVISDYNLKYPSRMLPTGELGVQTAIHWISIEWIKSALYMFEKHVGSFHGNSSFIFNFIFLKFNINSLTN